MAAPIAHAQTGHDDCDDCGPGEPIAVRLSARFFGGDEGKTYINVRGIYALPKVQDFNGRLSIQFLGTLSSKSDIDIKDGETLGHGGNDYEFRLNAAGHGGGGRYSAFVGFALPDTPAQSKSVNLTFGGKESWHVWHGGSVFVNPRGVCLPNNTLFGIGLGVDQRIEEGLKFGFDITPMFNGENTHSTDDGRFEREVLWDAHVGYHLQKRINVSAGVTNELGVTTGMSLTPGLGHSVAPYISVGVHF